MCGFPRFLGYRASTCGRDKLQIRLMTLTCSSRQPRSEACTEPIAWMGSTPRGGHMKVNVAQRERRMGGSAKRPPVLSMQAT